MQIIILAFSLAIDAFFVAFSIKLMLQKATKKVLYFSFLAAFFQILMPLIGFYITYFFSLKYIELIQKIDHFLVFIVFSYLAYGLFKNYKNPKNEEVNIDLKQLFILSILTSIDALGAGLMIFTLNLNIFKCVIIIGICTFILCSSVLFFSAFLQKIKQQYLELLGAFLLFFLGCKVMITHIIDGI